MDQVGDDFGVGLRFKRVAQAKQAFALLLVVFDDAVVHQRHAGTDVRMGIGLGDPTMGRPAGVADAELALGTLLRGGGLHFHHTAGATHTAYRPLFQHRDSGGVIATVFQPLQPFHQNRHHITSCDRADNSTHGRHPDDYKTRILAIATVPRTLPRRFCSAPVAATAVSRRSLPASRPPLVRGTVHGVSADTQAMPASGNKQNKIKYMGFGTIPAQATPSPPTTLSR